MRRGLVSPCNIHDRDIANQDPDRVYRQSVLSRLNEGTHQAFMKG